MPNPSELARIEAEITDLDTGVTMTAPARIHHCDPLSASRLPDLSLFAIAGAIHATKRRVIDDRTTTTSAMYDQLRGVRRLAAHIADLLSDSDKQAFLTACGYGA